MPTQLFKFNDSDAPKPEIPGSRKGEGRMSDSELQSVVAALISDAQELQDGELSPQREKATDYYLARPFGNEEQGRSQFVLSEVRDTVHGTLPDLLRVFFGPERAVEFVPSTAQGVEAAKQATEYVQYVFANDNAGFMRSYDVLVDGLVRKIGVFKWSYEDGRVTAHEEEGVSHDRLFALASRQDVQLTKVTPCDVDADDKDAAAQQGPCFDVEYTVKQLGRARVDSVPPEEFIFARNTRDLYEALFVGHRTEKRRGDLLALGISAKDLDEHGGRDATLDSNIEVVSRQMNQTQGIQRDPAAGEANDEILYVEGYYLIDVDGDGERELRRICTIGPNHYVVSNIAADEVPFSIFTPYPEPHTLVGQSQADLVMDLQLSKSMLARTMFDSFALSVFPRTAFIEGQASVEDILNTEIGAPIRMRRDNAVVPFSHPFTGEKAMPILQYLDDVSENRTGLDKGSMGLDADALQSSTKQAVNAAVTASQAQKEMLARLFAEQALKPLFKGLYRILVKNATQERIVRLRGSYVPVNPAQWDANMDVVVNVALGTSLVEQRIAALQMIAQEQTGLLQMLGPTNPLCTVAQLRETYARIVELSGIKDVASFFKEVDPNWQPPAPPAPPPSPEQINAQAQLQIEQMRVQKDLQIKQAELELKKQQQQWQQDFEERKVAADFTLRRYQIDAQFHAQFTEMNLAQDAEQEKAALEGTLSIQSQMHDQAAAAHQRFMDAQQQSHDQQLAQDQQQHNQQMAEAQLQQQQQAQAQQAGQGGNG